MVVTVIKFGGGAININTSTIPLYSNTTMSTVTTLEPAHLTVGEPRRAVANTDDDEDEVVEYDEPYCF